MGTYPITCTVGNLTASNYSFGPFLPGTLTVTAREGRVAYIGQTVFVSSGSSGTTAQVTLTASVWDPDGVSPVSTGTVTFKDLIANKVLASNVKVSPVVGGDVSTGTANTIVTLSTEQYGAQQYHIEVTLGGSFTNKQQLPPPVGTAAPGSDPYNSAHPTVTVMIPSTANSMQATSTLPKLATSAGKYGDATSATYTIGMKYNKGGTSPQGQIHLILERPDTIYYVKSNAITSFAASNPVNGVNKDVTIYTKASIYKIVGGVLTSIDGNVSLRVDAHEGCMTSPACETSNGDTIGFTILSSKDSSLYYANNWVYDTPTKAWRTVAQSVTSPNGTAVIIN